MVAQVVDDETTDQEDLGSNRALHLAGHYFITIGKNERICIA